MGQVRSRGHRVTTLVHPPCGPSCAAQCGWRGQGKERTDYLLVPGAGGGPGGSWPWPRGGHHPLRGTGRPGRWPGHVLLTPRPTWAQLTCGCSPGAIGPCPYSQAPSSLSRCSHWRTQSPLFLAVSPAGPFLPQGISRHLCLAAEPGMTPTLPGWPDCSGVSARRLRGEATPSVTDRGCVYGPGVPSAEASSPSAGLKLTIGVQLARCHGGGGGGTPRLCPPFPYLGEGGRRGSRLAPAHRACATCSSEPGAPTRPNPALPPARPALLHRCRPWPRGQCGSLHVHPHGHCSISSECMQASTAPRPCLGLGIKPH